MDGSKELSKSMSVNKASSLSNEDIKKFLKLVDDLKKEKNAVYYLEPVDPDKLKIPTYFTIIKHPMDLSTVEVNLKKKKYNSKEEVVSDLQLIWNNCREFNQVGSAIYKSADFMEKKTNNLLNKVFPGLVISKKKQGMVHNNNVPKDNLTTQSNNLKGSSKVNAKSSCMSEVISSNSKEMLQSEANSCHNVNNIGSTYQEGNANDSDIVSGDSDSQKDEDRLSLTEKIKLADQIRKMDNDCLCQVVKIIIENNKKAVMDENEEKIHLRLDILDRATYLKVREYMKPIFGSPEPFREDISNSLLSKKRK